MRIMKSGKIMTNAGFLKSVLTKGGTALFGLCSFERALPLLECRAKSRIPAGAKTVITCAFPYLVKERGERNLCYYASVPDYHRILGETLEAMCEKLREHYGGEFVPFIDNSPFREVKVAAMSGIGVIGDNRLLITKEYGSYVFLGEIVTDLEFVPTEKNAEGCLHCGACKRECRSGCLALSLFEKGKCLSDITQKKGELSSDEEELIKKGGLIWGCDSCQTCCPMNKNAKETEISEFKNNAKHFVSIEEIPEFIENSACAWRGEKVLRRNAELFAE